MAANQLLQRRFVAEEEKAEQCAALGQVVRAAVEELAEECVALWPAVDHSTAHKAAVALVVGSSMPAAVVQDTVDVQCTEALDSRVAVLTKASTARSAAV